MVELRPARAADAADLAPRLRPADLAELAAARPGVAPVDVLDRALAVSSDARALVYAGRVVALYGVAPIPEQPGVGSPWLLGAPELGRLGGVLVREGRRYLESVRCQYPRLLNAVHARNLPAVRYLARVGFAFGDAVNVNGEPFLIFGAGHV